MEPDVRKRQIMIWYTVAAVIGILLFQQFWSSYSQIETIAYSEFERLLDQGKIAEVTLTPQDGHLMSQSEQLKLQRSAATKAKREQRSEGGKICDHADKGMAGTRKSLGFLHVSKF